MRRLRTFTLAATLALTSLALPATALATPLNLALDIQGQGLSVADGGVGLVGLGNATRSFTVDIGGPVQAALLYWAGRDRPCPQSGGICVVPFQPYKDQVLRLDGNLITGTIIGTEHQPSTASGPVNNIGYLADVTSLVQAKGTGAQTFSIADGDIASNLFRLEGAGLVVVYTDAASSALFRVQLFHALDFAYGDDATVGPSRATTAITFNHGSDTGARQGSLRLFVGGGTAARPDQVDITNNASASNALDGGDGNAWDTDTFLVGIPAGVASTTVQVRSEPAGSNPDELLWQVALLRVPLSSPGPTFAYQPDAMIRRAGGPIQGNDVYNVTGEDQTLSSGPRRYRVGDVRWFYVYAQNDGSDADSFDISVSDPGSSPGYEVTYSLASAGDITAAIEAGTFTTPTVAAGARFGMRVRVELLPGVAHGSTLRRLFTITSVGDSYRQDAVGFTLRRR